MIVNQLRPGDRVTAVRGDHLEHAEVVRAAVRHAPGARYGQLAYVLVRWECGTHERVHARKVFPPLVAS